MKNVPGANKPPGLCLYSNSRVYLKLWTRWFLIFPGQGSLGDVSWCGSPVQFVTSCFLLSVSMERLWTPGGAARPGDVFQTPRLINRAWTRRTRGARTCEGLWGPPLSAPRSSCPPRAPAPVEAGRLSAPWLSCDSDSLIGKSERR